MINIFKVAMREVDPGWYSDYKETSETIAAVNNWEYPNQAPDDLLYKVIFERRNGIADVGQAYTAWPESKRPPAEKFRDALQRLKEGLNGRLPADNVAMSRKEFTKIAGKGIPSIFNRIVAGFAPDQVSPVAFDNDLENAYNRLIRGRYIGDWHQCPGDDPWYSRNAWMISKIKEQLPDGPCPDMNIEIDDYSRGIFVWGVHLMNWENWEIIRRVNAW